MTEMSRKPEAVAEAIRKAQRIAVCSHVNPDGDTLGASLALAHALRMLGKEVMLNVDDDIPSVFSFLPGIGEYMRFAPDDSVPADLLIVIDASSADTSLRQRAWRR